MASVSALVSYGATGWEHLASPAGVEIARWFFGGIFLWSGVSKLRRPTPAAIAIVEFGLHNKVHKMAGWSLGAIETLLAIALILSGSGMPFIAASALLFLFTLLIVRALLQGRSFECSCFGESGSAITSWSAVRTATLAVFALALYGPSAAQLTRLSDRALAGVAGFAALGICLLLSRLPGLLRSNSDPYPLRAV
jgi:uncharacterized membrane protein YphA (DoxX/SURF4 family)